MQPFLSFIFLSFVLSFDFLASYLLLLHTQCQPDFTWLESDIHTNALTLTQSMLHVSRANNIRLLLSFAHAHHTQQTYGTVYKQASNSGCICFVQAVHKHTYIYIHPLSHSLTPSPHTHTPKRIHKNDIRAQTHVNKYTQIYKYFMLCVLIVHSRDCLCRRGRKREEFQENFSCCLELVKFKHAQLFQLKDSAEFIQGFFKQNICEGGGDLSQFLHRSHSRSNIRMI